MSINKESLNHRVEAILKGINTVLRKEKITIVDDTPCMFHLEQTQDNPHIDLGCGGMPGTSGALDKIIPIKKPQSGISTSIIVNGIISRNGQLEQTQYSCISYFGEVFGNKLSIETCKDA